MRSCLFIRYAAYRHEQKVRNDQIGIDMEIGVSGASGQLGKAVIAELKARGGAHGIVGISRTPDTVQSPAKGRHGDYDQPGSLAKAYEGLDLLLVIPSNDTRPGKRDRHFVTAIDAAVNANVGHIVMISSGAARQTEPSAMYYPYFEGEQHLMKTAPRWTILRMNYFAETFAQFAPMAAQSGVMTGLGKNRVAFISRDDLAAAAAGILIGKGHAGAIYNATGPEAVTEEERVELVSKITGMPLQFRELDEAQLRDGMSQMGLEEVHINAFVDIEKSFVDGSFDIVTGDVERLAGRPPKSLRDVLTEKLTGSKGA